ncbi:EAL domain-containing protein [Persephonella sp.]
MISLSYLTHYIGPIVERYKKEILEDTSLSEFFTSPEEINHVAEQINRFITEAFSKENDDDIKKIFYNLGIYHAEREIPFVNVVSGLIYIKNEIYKKIIEEDHYKLLVPLLNSFFDTGINYFSKGYLDHSIDSFISEYKILDLWKQKNHKKFLLEWAIAVSKFIKGESKELPELDPKKCDLFTVLNSFDFQVKCPDREVYEKILRIHISVHNYGRNVIYYSKSKRFMEAYYLYKTFLAEVYRLLNDIDTVDFMFEMNKEDIFFKTVLEKTGGETPYITIINIRNLKIINKFYGTETGDKVLNSVTRMLQEILDYTQNIFIKGYSGDFYIFHRYKLEHPYNFGRFLKESLENIIVKNGIDIKFKVSIAILEVGKPVEKNELRKILNHAITKAKDTPEEVIFFPRDKVEDEFFSEIHNVFKNVSVVERAFKENKIDVHFQPIVSLINGKVNHLEALARINDNGKFIPAGAFIDLIYDMNLIKELDQAVLRKIFEYRKQIKKITDTVFINISANSISSPEFVNELVEKINKMKKEEIYTIIELTEQAFLDNIDLVKFLRKEQNIIFAVDDFGTGYSSVRTVYDLSEIDAIRYLKIDGSLIKNIDKEEKFIKPVETIISFAKTLGLETIAEFVENEAIANKLKNMKVEYGQGYFYYKPSGIKELVRNVLK